MKRENNLWNQVCSMDNLRLADAIAQQGKQKSFGVIRHNKKAEENLLLLHNKLISKTFQAPQYNTFKVFDKKERTVYSSPYYPNLILDYAILIVVGPILEKTFTADTYACIKGRGVHKAVNDIKESLRHEPASLYYLKIDVRKFYPSINHDIMKSLIRRKIKDKDLLWLLDLIIDSAPGLPIGRYLSQMLSNYYLSKFDHWVKEDLNVIDYYRYVDDIVIFSKDKKLLHNCRKQIAEYIDVNLKLQLKSNWRVAPIRCGLRILGYKFYGDYTLIDKDIKKSFARAVAKKKGQASIASYRGWASHADSKHLLKKLLSNEKL